MKRLFTLFCAAMLGASCTCPEPLTLRYDAPAEYFEEALPIGNGRIGAMVYGGPVTDRISLNDITLWTGEPDKGEEHPDFYLSETMTPWGEAASWFEKVREALDNEDYREADRLQRHVQGHYSENYQPLGSLEITYPEGEITEYRRLLDISDAHAEVTYKKDGKLFKAEYIASAPDFRFRKHAHKRRLCGMAFISELLPQFQGKIPV